MELKDTIHSEPSEYAGKKVKVSFRRAPNKQFKKKRGTYEIEVIDYWDRLNNGVSWGESNGNPAALLYAVRAGASWPFGIPEDDEVLYGHDEFNRGHLFHVKEIVKK